MRLGGGEKLLVGLFWGTVDLGLLIRLGLGGSKSIGSASWSGELGISIEAETGEEGGYLVSMVVLGCKEGGGATSYRIARLSLLF